MCLLVESHATTVLPEALLASVYRKNSDGLGVMWAEDGLLKTHKALPRNLQEFLDFYERFIKGKECYWHARWRTHGNIDLANCHPYHVYGDGAPMPVALMHNGVLQTGNAADTSMSDTWHYINDFIIPTTRDAPQIIFVPEYAKIIASHIGSGNKFALMNHLGQMQTVNRQAGVTYNGAWFSNTYAWDSHTYLNPPSQRSWNTGNLFVRQSFTAPPPPPPKAHKKGKKQTVKSDVRALPNKDTTGPRLTPEQQDAIDQQGELIRHSAEFSSQINLARLERLNHDIGSVAAWETVLLVGEGLTAQQMMNILVDSKMYKAIVPSPRRDLPMDIAKGNQLAQLAGLDFNRE